MIPYRSVIVFTVPNPFSKEGFPGAGIAQNIKDGMRSLYPLTEVLPM